MHRKASTICSSSAVATGSRALALMLLAAAPGPAAKEASFFRGINLNGPALTIDGRSWEAGKEAKDFKATGKTFANQKVILKPSADAARTQMIRSSVWGAEVKLEVNDVPPGVYQCFLYVWDKVHVHDFHATILHLLGIDHERLTYRYGGRDYRLTDVFGNVVGEILA